MKIGISYSWDDEEHRNWVRALADRLRSAGFEVLYDRGQQLGVRLPRFMEQMVSQSVRVLVICTAKYKHRFDKRQGGVGYEGNLISGEIVGEEGTAKFIPVLRRDSWEEALPLCLVGALGADLRDSDSYEERYEALIEELSAASERYRDGESADAARRRFEPDEHVETLIKDVKLAAWDAATVAALKVIETTDPASGKNVLFEALFSYQGLAEGDDRFWGALHTLETCVRTAPWLITRAQFSRMAHNKNMSVRASAASICMDLAHSSPAHVPLDIAIKLSVYDEDWYVEAPANAALKAMASSFPEVLGVFFMRLQSPSPGERSHAASQLESVASQEPHLLDQERLTAELSRLRRLNDSEAADLLGSALSKVEAAPKRDWYRYGL